MPQTLTFPREDLFTLLYHLGIINVAPKTFNQICQEMIRDYLIYGECDV